MTNPDLALVGIAEHDLEKYRISHATFGCGWNQVNGEIVRQ